MSINFNHVTNDITASSGSVSINGSVPGSGGASAITISNQTAAYTVVAGDLEKIINCTSGTFTVSLTAAATLGAGFNCWIWNTGTGIITVDPNSAETIDGKTTISLYSGEGTQIVCDGTNWQSGDKKRPRLYAENSNISGNPFPVASGVSSVAIGAGAQAVAASAMALGASYAGGAKSFSAANDNGTSSYGALGDSSIAVGENSKATTTGGVAIGGLCVANSTYSTAIGRNSNSQGAQAFTGSGAMALGGSYASGTDSFAAAVLNNTSTYGATGPATIAIGNYSKSTGTRSTAIGYYATASGTGGVAIGGYAYGASATGIYAVAIGDGCAASGIGSTAIGWYNTVSGKCSLVFGSENQGIAVDGKLSWGPNVTPGSGVPAGNPRCGTTVLTYTTTNATPAVLTVASTAGNNAPSSTNQIILPNNSAYAFTGTIIARRRASETNDFAAWEIKGGIVRNSTAASVSLGSYNINPLSTTAGAATWTIALSADTTNGGLAITVTGEASASIRWVATINTTEVIYL